MNKLLQSSLSGIGLALVIAMGSTSAAAPKKGAPVPSTKAPLPKAPDFTYPGLTKTITLTPRSLYASLASLDVHSAKTVDASSNRARLGSTSQLILRFAAAASKSYRIDCNFNKNPQVLVMEYANGAIVRQAQSNPANGVLNHTVSAASGIRQMKIFFLTGGDTDWTQCKVTPQ